MDAMVRKPETGTPQVHVVYHDKHPRRVQGSMRRPYRPGKLDSLTEPDPFCPLTWQIPDS